MLMQKYEDKKNLSMKLLRRDLIETALSGERGPSQKLIAETGLDWVETLLRKNTDYGDTVFNPSILRQTLPVREAILVRMSDKIARLQRLLQGNEAEVRESIEDTMKDLGAYALLYICATKKMEPK